MKRFFTLRFDWLDAALALFFCSAVLKLNHFFKPGASGSVTWTLLTVAFIFALLLRRLIFGPAVKRHKKPNLVLGVLSNLLVIGGTLIGALGIMLMDQADSIKHASEQVYVSATGKRQPTADLAVTAEDIDFEALNSEIAEYEKGNHEPKEMRPKTRQSLMQTLSEYKLKAFVVLCIGILLVILGGVVERTRELRS